MHRQKIIFLFVLITFFISGFTVQVNSFMAAFEGLDVKLTWNIADDTSVRRFDIFRKDQNEADYRKIATMPVQNTGTYYFIDDNLYKNEGDEGVIYYKLVVVGYDKNTSFFTNVHHNPTAIQRSWGSIKAMFR